jgi:hypothetical protein
MADGIDCPEAIEQWFARCQPKIDLGDVSPDALTIDDSPRDRDSIVDAGRGFGHFEQLLATVRELQVVVFGAEP